VEKNGKPKEVKGAIVTEADPRYFSRAPLRRRGANNRRQHVLEQRPQRA